MPYKNVHSPDSEWHSQLCQTIQGRTLKPEHLCVNMNHGSCLTFCNQTLGIQDLHAPSCRRNIVSSPPSVSFQNAFGGSFSSENLSKVSSVGIKALPFKNVNLTAVFRILRIDSRGLKIFLWAKN